MVVLEAFGLAAAELFNYNRDVYKFDQEQRLEKDMRRVEMQIKRFDLFREDIEDLVQLTVGKMDMYHMVGALMLAFTCTIYTEGLFRGIEPPWVTGVYYMSVCNSFVYLLLAVWLSMHASIQAQSYGVRLRTRFVRLPIPSLSVITDLTARFSDFEKQGLGQVMRVPFSGGGQDWKMRGQTDPKADENQRRPAEWRDRNARTDMAAQEAAQGTQSEDLIGRGDDGFGREHILTKAAENLPGRHVELFRRFQSKWQCYDAYARVAMSWGVNQMVQSVNYFVILSCTVERNQPSTAIAATAVFQCVALGLSFLDLADKPIAKCLPISRTGQIIILQCVGSAPAVLTLLVLILADADRGANGRLDPFAPSFYAAPAVFFLQALYFNLMLIAAWPSRDGASLPRKFLSVLFLDVFGDAAYDPTEAEQAPIDHGEGKSVHQETRIAHAERSLETAHAALRRWEAIPQELLSQNQREQLEQHRSDYLFWRRRLQGHVTHQKLERGVHYDPAAARDHHELRGWGNLSAQEKREDHFADAMIGPLTKRRGISQGTYWYHLEENKHVFTVPEGRGVVTLNAVAELCNDVKESVRHVLASKGSGEKGGDDDEDEDGDEADDDDDGSPVVAAGEQKRERLPWKTMRRLTSLLQIGWAFLGIQLALQDAGWMDISFMYGGGEDDDWRRRRLVSPQVPLLAEDVPATWPHAGFFRPTALSCVPSASNTDRLWIGGPYSVYQTVIPEASSTPLRMTPMPRGSLPAGSVAFCKPAQAGLESTSDSPECLLGILAEGGLAVWRYGDPSSSATILPFEGQPWRSMAGSVLRCNTLAAQQAVPADGGASWCLVLAGWDGERIPVAIIPLSAGVDREPRIAAGTAVRPRFDVPLDSDPATTKSGVTALHLDPGTGRLFVLLRGTGGAAAELQAWGLTGEQRSFGRRQLPTSPVAGGSSFEPAALCAASSGGLLVAGLSGEAGVPQLLRLRGAEVLF